MLYLLIILALFNWDNTSAKIEAIYTKAGNKISEIKT